VVLAGLVSPSELSALYGMARLLAYVPLIEGYGLPPVEAMTFGAPVVATRRLPSTVGAAYEVDPYDVESIAEGLRVVATDEAERSSLQALGLDRATRLTWSAMARRHVAVWQEADRPKARLSHG
jgi:glycosyltransferase involved in cell wall biosynthesis